MQSGEMNHKLKISKDEIIEALKHVRDPEIPTISIVDLGIVTDVTVAENNTVKITLTPTFSGCPAIKIMENLVEEKIKSLGVPSVEVITNFEVNWNTDKITDEGLEALKQHGLVPPPRHNGLVQIEILSNVTCPLCGSKNTRLQTPFGPTLCRSIHYCNDCLNAFEQFKPVS